MTLDRLASNDKVFQNAFEFSGALRTSVDIERYTFKPTAGNAKNFLIVIFDCLAQMVSPIPISS
jgi:hypothetical protein